MTNLLDKVFVDLQELDSFRRYWKNIMEHDFQDWDSGIFSELSADFLACYGLDLCGYDDPFTGSTERAFQRWQDSDLPIKSV